MSEFMNTRLVWDNHVCLPHDTDPVWLEELLRHARSGVDIVMLSIAGSDDVEVDVLLRQAAHYRRWVETHPVQFAMIESADDVLRARQQGQLGIAFNVEAPRTIGDRLDRIQAYYDLGVRWMVMAYNANNQIGGGCHDIDDGLTPFGFEVIAEMDRVGMVKCCSHTGYRTAMDVLRNTDKPTIFSHSNPRTLCDHPRNIPDDLIRACADTRGVVGINGVGLFLGDDKASPVTFSEHVDYVVQLVGIDHVCIGTDYTYGMDELNSELAGSPDLWPPGFGYESDIPFMPPEALSDVVSGLQKKGYAERDLDKMLGENLLRIARNVWV